MQSVPGPLRLAQSACRLLVLTILHTIAPKVCAEVLSIAVACICLTDVAVFLSCNCCSRWWATFKATALP